MVFADLAEQIPAAKTADQKTLSIVDYSKSSTASAVSMEFTVKEVRKLFLSNSQF